MTASTFVTILYTIYILHTSSNIMFKRWMEINTPQFLAIFGFFATVWFWLTCTYTKRGI